MRPMLPGQFATALLSLALSAPACAQTAPARLGLCASCHGELGVATSALIPNLAAQNIDYLRNAVEQYRSGVRDVAAMRAALGMVSKTEVDAILQWYSRQTPDSTK